MKKRLLILQVFSFICFMGFAQAPKSIPYQAVARDASGNLMENKLICVQYGVYTASSGGSPLYQEHRTVTTNALGLFTINVGSPGATVTAGTDLGNGSIGWANNSTLYIEVDLDVTGACSAYTVFPRTQMMSVPFALYAANSGSVPSGNLTDAGTDGINVTSGTNAVLGSGTSIAQQKAGSATNGYLSSGDWNTFNNKQNTISLSTTGSSGAATFNTGTGALNIPDYTLAGLGGQAPLTFNAPLSNSSNTVSLGYDNSTIMMNGSNQLYAVNTGTVTGVSASNGLTSSGGNTPAITLGGTLTGATTISQAGYNLTYSGGNVGIGTIPSLPLDVSGTVTQGIRYIKTGDADARINLGDNSGTTWSWSCGWGAGSGGAAGDFSLLQEGVTGDVIYVQKATNNVGIGTVTPASLFSVGSGSQFQVNSSGNLVKINNVAYSWTGSQGGASTVLTNDGSGNLSWAGASSGGFEVPFYFRTAGSTFASTSSYYTEDEHALAVANLSGNPASTAITNSAVNRYQFNTFESSRTFTGFRGNFMMEFASNTTYGVGLTITVAVYKYTPVNGSTAGLTGTLIGSGSTGALATSSGTNETYPISFAGNGTTINPGDAVMVYINSSSNGWSGSTTFDIIGTLEFK